MKQYKLYNIIRPIIKSLFYLIYRPKVIGKENIKTNGSFILAGNHTHALDPILLASTTKRDIRFLAKKELHKGMKKHIFEALGTIPIDRSKKNDEAVEVVLQALQENQLIGIFPEGTRNKSDKLLPFKYGAISLAIKSQTKIIPFAIKGKYVPFIGRPKIIIGKQIDILEMDYEKANEYLKETIETILRSKN